jgi:hypothetical protein
MYLFSDPLWLTEPITISDWFQTPLESFPLVPIPPPYSPKAMTGSKATTPESREHDLDFENFNSSARDKVKNTDPNGGVCLLENLENSSSRLLSLHSKGTYEIS